MGWASGTSIFDAAAKAATEKSSTVKKVIAALFDAMEAHDWDTFCESAYYDHPLIREAVESVRPGYEWYDESEDE